MINSPRRPAAQFVRVMYERRAEERVRAMRAGIDRRYATGAAGG